MTSDNDLLRDGGCACGAIRFQATGAPKWVAHCHCVDCRRATGSPLTTYAGYLEENVSFARGQAKQRQSSPGTWRGWCGDCGTPLFYRSTRWAGEIHLFVATFDQPETFAPQGHVYVSEQLPWIHLGDDLPRLDTTGIATS